MAMTMHVDIVSLEHTVYSGRATFLSATGVSGSLGIYPGHTPLLTQLTPGVVTLKKDNGEEDQVFISGGFLEVQPGMAMILADTVVRGEADEAEAQRAKEQAENDMKNNRSSVDYARAQLQLYQALGKLQIAKELGKN